MYTISYWHIDSYSELYEFTQDEMFENTVICGTGSVRENPDIRYITNFIAGLTDDDFASLSPELIQKYSDRFKTVYLF